MVMTLDPLVSEYADFCPICEEMAILCWGDRDLNVSVCDDCASCLARAEHVLGALDLDHPSLDLIDRNP